mgnify:CR=1 FL=1
MEAPAVVLKGNGNTAVTDGVVCGQGLWSKKQGSARNDVF